MRVARYAEIAWTSRPQSGGTRAADVGLGAPGAEQAKSVYRPLFASKHGDPSYFEMVVSDYRVPKYYPRHHHKVDQLRWTLRGASPWADGMQTPEGSLLYIPAGTYYGPYERPAGVELMAIQFGDADPAQLVDRAGQAPSKPRFTTPIEMNPTSFRWSPLPDGAEVKHFGTFGDLGTHLWMIGLEPGRSCSLPCTGQTTYLFVTAGCGSAGDTSIQERDAIHLEPDDALRLNAATRLELLALGLPRAAERHP